MVSLTSDYHFSTVSSLSTRSLASEPIICNWETTKLCRTNCSSNHHTVLQVFFPLYLLLQHLINLIQFLLSLVFEIERLNAAGLVLLDYSAANNIMRQLVLHFQVGLSLRFAKVQNVLSAWHDSLLLYFLTFIILLRTFARLRGLQGIEQEGLHVWTWVRRNAVRQRRGELFLARYCQLSIVHGIIIQLPKLAILDVWTR